MRKRTTTIKVLESTRKKLKLLAVHLGKTMMELLDEMIDERAGREGIDLGKDEGRQTKRKQDE